MCMLLQPQGRVREGNAVWMSARTAPQTRQATFLAPSESAWRASRHVKPRSNVGLATQFVIQMRHPESQTLGPSSRVACRVRNDLIGGGCPDVVDPRSRVHLGFELQTATVKTFTKQVS